MKKINWGVLGTANIARKHTIAGIQQSKYGNLYAIAGRSQAKVDSFVADFGFEKGYTDYNQLILDDNIQAVYIPLSNDMHYQWAIKAMQNKKHVLCEKPLAPTAKQVEELFAIASQNNVVLMEAFAYLHSPYIQAMVNDIRSGAIGEVMYIESAFLTNGYDDSNIRLRKDTFGGAMYDLGCYCTSLSQYIFGIEARTVNAIAQFSSGGVDIHTSATINYGNGKMASLTCGMNLPDGQRIDRWRICGTKGEIVSHAQFNQCGQLQYTLTTDGKSTLRTIPTPQNYFLEVEQMNNCILNGAQPLVSSNFSISNAQLIDAILAKVGY